MTADTLPSHNCTYNYIYTYEWSIIMTDIIIIGAGPAGLTAAIYARRADKSVVILEKGVFGGQMTFSPKIENYPGFNEVSGNELAEKMIEQALSLGAEIEMAEVTGIDPDGDIKKVYTEDSTLEAKTVILATGAEHRKLGLMREDDLIGSGISFCAVCDGAFFSDEDVVVVGGGNSAMQEALLLSETSKSVTMIQNLSDLTGEKALADRIHSKDNIKVITDSVVTAYLGDTEIEGVIIKNTVNGTESRIPCKGVFLAVGLLPATDILKDKIKLSEYGYIDADEGCATNIPGVFTAGDCRTKSVRQITTATADGAAAALAAVKFTESRK